MGGEMTVKIVWLDGKIDYFDKKKILSIEIIEDEKESDERKINSMRDLLKSVLDRPEIWR